MARARRTPTLWCRNDYTTTDHREGSIRGSSAREISCTVGIHRTRLEAGKTEIVKA